MSRTLYDTLRALVLDGRLAPGARLPSSRALAAGLGVGRNTVAAAYDLLQAEGFVSTRIGSGTTVSPALPPEVLRPAQDLTAVPRPLPPLSRLAAALPPRPAGPVPPRPFRPGLPALEAFPWAEWGRLLGRRWRRPRPALALGGDIGGLPALREAIARHLNTARGVVCTPEQVLILAGAQQALDVAARLVLDPGAAVVVEDPGFSGVTAVLRLAGAVIHPQPIDGEGLTLPPPELACRAVVVTPSRNFPLGITMSLPRRLALLDWAAAAGSWVVEDDFDAEFRFSGPPLAALQGLDRDGRVLYVGTFTRALFPGLRLGFLVVPPPLVGPALAVRQAVDGAGATVAQAALADFIGEGRFAGHLRAMRQLYAARGAALAAALDLPPPDGGMHLVLPLDEARDDQDAARRLGAQGFTALPLSGYYQRPAAARGLVLGFAGWGEDVLLAAVAAGGLASMGDES